MRFRVLDSWRGIAALLVATYHFEVTWHWHEIALVRHSFLFVDFFFVLSGFVIAHAYGRKINSGDDLVSFIVRRFGRLWPLSALVLLAFVAVEALKLVLAKGFGISTGTAPFDPHGYTPLSALPTHFLLTTALNLQETLTWNGPDWSISAEFWTYLLIGVISLAATGWRTALVALSGLAAAIVLMAFSKRGMDVTYELGFVRCVYGFMIGQLIYETRRRLTQNSLPGLAFFEYVAIGLVIAFVWSVGRGPASFLAPLVFAVPVFVFSFEAGALSRGLLSRPARPLHWNRLAAGQHDEAFHRGPRPPLLRWPCRSPRIIEPIFTYRHPCKRRNLPNPGKSLGSADARTDNLRTRNFLSR